MILSSSRINIILLINDTTVTDLEYPVETFYHAMIVSDNQDRGMVFHRQFLQERHDILAILGIKRCGRLIGQDHPGFGWLRHVQ